MKRMPSWSQKIEARTFQQNFALGIFWGRMSHYAATPLIVALSPWHSDITRFCPWSPIATGNNLDHAEIFQKLLRWLAPLMFLIHVQAFRDPLRGDLCMSKSSWMMDPTHSREMRSCSAFDVVEIRRSFKISSWIWSVISGMVTVLGRPGRGASQVEKSPRLNWSTQFLTVV